jgi:hypothetical protein
LAVEKSQGFEEGFSSDGYGMCADWRYGFTNNSDTDIIQITFNPVSASYFDLYDVNPSTGQYPPDIPAVRPPPVILNVSIPAHSAQQVLSFQTCTSTTAPINLRYQLTVTPPRDVSFQWVNGFTGLANV